MRCGILSIGNELLIGQVVNTNASWLGGQLTDLGVEMTIHLTVGDDHDSIVRHLKALAGECDLVVTTGGLGPTRDDITKKAMAEAAGTEMVFHQPTWDKIQAWFSKRNYPVSDLHYEQCYMPVGAEILENDMGTAPGLQMQMGSCIVYILPGVPYEMQHICERHILPYVQKIMDGPKLYKHTFLTAGTGETVIADHIRHFEEGLPEGYSIAYLPSLGQVRVRLNGQGDEGVFKRKVEELRGLLKKWLYGEGAESLEEVLGKVLLKKKLTVATAESCTGGTIASIIAAVPGASRYFRGSVVAYHNDIKQNMLRVPAEVLERDGAVSEACVTAMVQGLLPLIQADLGIAVSGIAGPDGGSEEKPVGTIWIAVGDRETVRTIRLQFNKDRRRNIAFTASQAMNALRLFVLEKYGK
jgi:nicotinamide-nucleotide amidase